MAKSTTTPGTGKKVIYLCYTTLICIQVFIEYQAWKLTRLHEHIARDSELAVYLGSSQPLMWFFTLVTLVIFVDTARNSNLTMMSMILVFTALVLATVFMQLFTMLAGYVPVLEMNSI